MLTWGMHKDADDETANGAAGQVQSRALLHARVTLEAPLGEEVGGELNGAPEARPDHGGVDSTVQTSDALGPEDLRQPVNSVAVLVLGADGSKGRVALQPCLYEEEGAARSSAHDARRGAGEDIDAQILRVGVLEEHGGHPAAQRLVQTQTAAVEEDLVDVGAAQATVDAPNPFAPHDDADAVDGATIVVW